MTADEAAEARKHYRRLESSLLALVAALILALVVGIAWGTAWEYTRYDHVMSWAGENYLQCPENYTGLVGTLTAFRSFVVVRNASVFISFVVILLGSLFVLARVRAPFEVGLSTGDRAAMHAKSAYPGVLLVAIGGVLVITTVYRTADPNFEANPCGPSAKTQPTGAADGVPAGSKEPVIPIGRGPNDSGAVAPLGERSTEAPGRGPLGKGPNDAREPKQPGETDDASASTETTDPREE